MTRFLIQHRQQLLLLGTLFSLSLADAVITRYIVSMGLGTERNPVLRPVVLEAGFYWIKIFGTLIAEFLLWHLYTRYHHKIVAFTAFLVGAYLLVVYWNVGIVLLGSV